MKNLCMWLFIVASLVFSHTTQAQTNNNYGGFLGTVNSLSFLGTTGGGIDQYGMVVSTTDFTAIWNGTDVDTQNWVWWSAKSNGCSRYAVSNVVGTTATQISIVLDDVDGGGIPSNDLGVLVKESDLCELGHWIASGGVFSLQSHNQCMSSYYLDNLENCGFGSVSTDSLTIVEITPVMPDDSLSVDMALPSPCVDGAIAIYIGNGTVANPDYVWRVYDDNGDCRAIEIESPAVSEFVYECADTLSGAGLQIGDAVDITATTATLSVFDGANIPDRVIVRDYGDGTYLAAHCGCWEQDAINHTGGEDFYYFSDEVGTTNGTGLNIVNDTLEINLFEIQPDKRMCVDIKAYRNKSDRLEYTSLFPICCNDDLESNNRSIVSNVTAWVEGDDRNSIFTDAGFTNVTADGDLINTVISTEGATLQSAGGEEPIYRTGGLNGLSYLEFTATNATRLEGLVQPATTPVGTPFELSILVSTLPGGGSFPNIIALGSGSVLPDYGLEIGRMQIGFSTYANSSGGSGRLSLRTMQDGSYPLNVDVEDIEIVPQSQVNDGVPHLITAMYDGSASFGGTNTVRVYVDGVLELTHAPTVPVWSNYLRFGHQASNAGNSMNMNLYEYVQSSGNTLKDTELINNYISCKWGVDYFTVGPITELACGNYGGETSYYQLLVLNEDGSVTTQYIDTVTNTITNTLPYEGLNVCTGCSLSESGSGSVVMAFYNSDGDLIIDIDGSQYVQNSCESTRIDTGSTPSDTDPKACSVNNDESRSGNSTWYHDITGNKRVVIDPSDTAEPKVSIKGHSTGYTTLTQKNVDAIERRSFEVRDNRSAYIGSENDTGSGSASMGSGFVSLKGTMHGNRRQRGYVGGIIVAGREDLLGSRYWHIPISTGLPKWVMLTIKVWGSEVSSSSSNCVIDIIAHVAISPSNVLDSFVLRDASISTSPLTFTPTLQSDGKWYLTVDFGRVVNWNTHFKVDLLRGDAFYENEIDLYQYYIANNQATF